LELLSNTEELKIWCESLNCCQKTLESFVVEKPKSFLEFVNGKVVKKLRS